jgi:hypothetical protein
MPKVPKVPEVSEKSKERIMYPRLIALVIALSLVPSRLVAQTAADPSGHWEGSFQTAEISGVFEIDLQKTSNGNYIGTVTIPAENVKGLPLSKVHVDGERVTFSARDDQPTTVRISDDGKTMSGDMTAQGYRLPVSLTRTGDAKIEAPVTSAAVASQFEGTWNGTITSEGKQVRLVLSLTNQPGGRAVGSIVNLDQGNLTIPVSAITQTASEIAIELKSIAVSYSASLNADGTELAGTFTQGTKSAPLTFQRARQ